MRVLQIKYKQIKFEVLLEDEGQHYKVDSLRQYAGSENEIVENYLDDVFFSKFIGETFLKVDEHVFMTSVKRSFSKFAKDFTSDDNETESPLGAVDQIIHDTVGRALSSSETKSKVDVLIKELIKEHGIVPHRTLLEVKFKNQPKKDVGLQHKSFSDVLSTLSAGVNIALVGPAGSGKTTIVSNAAKVLKLSFASQSVSAQSTVFDFFGYKSATGDYIGTMFREKYENGGVFLLDEFDAGNPNVLAALNQATANGHCPFPDKMIEKHKDFIIVMAGNTFGGGGTIDYVGRNKIDAATLDRFAFIYIDYDEKLENALSSNADWCSLVQAYRQRAIDKKIRTIISPRATFNGEKLLSAGLPLNTVLDMIIFKGLNQDELSLLKI